VPLTGQDRVTDSYPVEASGWDSDQTFFVEKSELRWDEPTGKHLTLSRCLCPGSLVFLRLLQPISLDRSLSVAYRAEHVEVTSDGQQKFRLIQIQPNSISKD
jgi:hypothetical protein